MPSTQPITVPSRAPAPAPAGLHPCRAPPRHRHHRDPDLAPPPRPPGRPPRRTRGGLPVQHRQFGLAAAGYARDFQDRIFTYTWRSTDTGLSDFPDLNFSTPWDSQAASAQAVDILRRLSTRTDPGDIPSPISYAWLPHPYYSHLVLQDYLSHHIPEKGVICPEDRDRLNWQNDPENLFDNNAWSREQPDANRAREPPVPLRLQLRVRPRRVRLDAELPASPRATTPSPTTASASTLRTTSTSRNPAPPSLGCTRPTSAFPPSKWRCTTRRTATTSPPPALLRLSPGQAAHPLLRFLRPRLSLRATPTRAGTRRSPPRAHTRTRTRRTPGNLPPSTAKPSRCPRLLPLDPRRPPGRRFHRQSHQHRPAVNRICSTFHETGHPGEPGCPRRTSSPAGAGSNRLTGRFGFRRFGARSLPPASAGGNRLLYPAPWADDASSQQNLLWTLLSAAGRIQPAHPAR